MPENPQIMDSPAAAASQQPCEKPPYESCADQKIGGLYKHDPATCWWCLNPQSETELKHRELYARRKS